MRTCVMRAGAHNRECDLLVVLPAPGAMLLCDLALCANNFAVIVRCIEF